ncbi:DNA polymerase epsilon catalytic subunit [Meloidogyne graminicola]|uniref:DNA polymerase epsilon catalytic subunit n=1 Tax=Meloidogyne graminicola TaxID=189291 RepID=A0A8T0A1A5_9BILA|nr:DNA polymerase epsilon catalytic subunit [Meloidogyne graminicola]KAF7639303.1 DNA polymerase epsilon catalytic subunit [Meloidogyne graminicola]
MFHRLVKDIHYGQNLIADQLVVNMHRWLSNPNSLLFNPSIKNALNILMKKLCLLLVAEMQKLGAKIIFCSFKKIILSTERHSLPLAKSFINSLLISINKKPIFASLQLGIIHFSVILLWIDSSNYAYVYASDEEKKNGRVEAKFGLANKITGEIKNKFIIMIAGFIGMLWNKKKGFNEEELKDRELISEYSIKILKEEIIDSLFRLTTKLVVLRPKLEEMAKENASLDIPLEFINCACRVLSVNPALEDLVDNLRSQLLLIIQKDGTISKSQNNLIWIPPSPIILENIFCPKCLQNSDLDVNNNDDTLFVCSYCRNEYPLSLIEEMLIERTSKMQASFALQDWKCVSCKKIGANFLIPYCECSNKFEYTIKQEKFMNNLDMVKRVAIKHKLENLEYVVNHVKQCFMNNRKIR